MFSSCRANEAHANAVIFTCEELTKILLDGDTSGCTTDAMENSSAAEKMVGQRLDSGKTNRFTGWGLGVGTSSWGSVSPCVLLQPIETLEPPCSKNSVAPNSIKRFLLENPHATEKRLG